ncbi:MAG: carbohydrate porin, partial [Geopsychrobacter sp.]|nr:carbohydrate porin [Geopsychrobacter sp.]
AVPYSVLFGLHDFTSEFDALEYGGLFINSSFGISPDISQNGPSIFPSAALGLRAKAESKHTYIMGAIYDGVPDDSGDAPRTRVALKEQDGIFAALELGLKEDDPDKADYYKLAFGVWVHTAEVENFNGQVHNYNRGFYLIGEKMLYAEKAEGQGLGAFIQLGLADKDLNQITTYWGFGLHYTGLINGHNKDILGLAVAQALIGEEFLAYSKDVLGVDVEHSETAIELTYRSEISPSLTLQPDIQYIINPSMDSAIDNALQLGIRLELTF